MTGLGIATGTCAIATALFGVLGVLLTFLQLHLGDDDAVRKRLDDIYREIVEHPATRLPRALLEALSRFHADGPRYSWRRWLERWWVACAFAMLLLADATLAIWFPQDLVEFYQAVRSNVLEDVPFRVVGDNVTFALGVALIPLALMIFSKVMTATDSYQRRSAHDYPRTSDPVGTAVDWLTMYLGGLLGLLLTSLVIFGIVGFLDRLDAMPATLGVVISLMSFPFIAVILTYIVAFGLMLLEWILKLIFAVFLLLRSAVLRRLDPRIERLFDNEHVALDWIFANFEYCMLFVLGLSLSMAMTFVAFAIGQFLHPDIAVPRTFQLVACNALGDGLTLSLTFVLVRWAVSSGLDLWRIPLAIVVTIGLASVFAGSSLYVGLWGSPQAMSPAEVLNVLLGYDRGGTARVWGPYFWIAHTTFLPLAAYFSMLAVLWLIKLAVEPASRLIRHATGQPQPLKYLAVASSLYAALFTALAVVLKQLG